MTVRNWVDLFLKIEMNNFRYLLRTSIKIPTASSITKDNIVSLDWGIFTVYEVVKDTNTCTEKLIIIRSDDTDTIRTEISNYFTENNS